ncbi:MAG TPA: hypothetical protein O0X70_02555 [Methanocorpusculum sp.]|nr:hypothetical protein [Methanocorpusculum sp.]
MTKTQILSQIKKTYEELENISKAYKLKAHEKYSKNRIESSYFSGVADGFNGGAGYLKNLYNEIKEDNTLRASPVKKIRTVKRGVRK